MIKIERLTKNYGSNLAVDDISFEVGAGETVGFLGPNGAGKSTTMNILTGYLSASAGRVLIDGVDILSDPIGAKKMIGYLPEQPPVYLDMTVDEYLNFNYELKGCKLPREEHLAEICASLSNVWTFLTRKPSGLFIQHLNLLVSFFLELSLSPSWNSTISDSVL